MASALVSLLLTGGSAAAHPHVFVDTGLRIVIDDDGQLVGVEVTWMYDALYSMLTFEGLGLDGDYDGRLNDAELIFLDGFDLNWIEGFAGDLYLERDGLSLTLGPPQGRGVEVQEARIVTRHFRALTTPVEADGVAVRAYDPTYYTAYDLTVGVQVEGTCGVQIIAPDIAAAERRVTELLEALPATYAADAFPEVGAAFADTVVIGCDG